MAIKNLFDEPILPSHPWISFTLDLSRLDIDLWMLLGEARSKSEHLAKAPLKPELADQLHRVLLGKGVHATTAIEGNTLSEDDVQKIIENRLTLPKSQHYLQKEVENVLDAIESMFSEAMESDDCIINVPEILTLNGMVLEGLDLEEGVVPGQFRSHKVGVANYSAPSPQVVEDLMDRMCTWLNGEGFTPKNEHRIPFGILRAIMAHLYIAWIHPFGDGNGRTARAVEFKILVSCGVPSPAAHLLSNHYNLTRSQYYRELSYASQSGGDVSRFLRYAVHGFVDGLRSQLKPVWDHLYSIAWKDYVYEAFKEHTSKAAVRQRRLLFAMSEIDEPVPMKNLLRFTSIALIYAGLTDLTLRRDLNELGAMGLVRRDKQGYRAKTEIVSAFAPGAHS